MSSRSNCFHGGLALGLVLAACSSSSSEPPTATAVRAIAAPADSQTVTLITGDRVIVSPRQQPAVRVEPGAGREHVGFLTQTVRGETLVIPQDVAPMLASGQLDHALFNVTELLAQGLGDDRRDDLPLLVTGHADAAAARSQLASADVTIHRVMPALHAVAARQRKGAAPSLIAQLASAPGQRVWLDRRLQLTLDHSVPQIGGPAAWARGLTGAGVVVAVLDTGVDAGHPDLAGRIQSVESFVDDGLGASDVHGHGTHVASILAGSGAASAGLRRGVAPDATLVSGRVCDAFGTCATSDMLAGMEWAVVTQHARIVNMSIGGPDTEGIDPLEDAVNRLSAEHGALFVIAAGNSGRSGAGTVESPGTADAALAVGAIDRDDQLAVFSSRGPRRGDFAVKPELTAPGVNIVAARAKLDRPPIGVPVDDAYQQLSGTSMATPHVAGAAAILAQQHPDWTGAQLKAALIASASTRPAQTAFEQGGGRVDIARAIQQDVVAEPATVAFGQADFPHDDDPILSRTVTYRNAGSAPVTLAITGALVHDGVEAAGMLAISPASITVPAGGSADVALTVDTRGDRPDGGYAGELIASGGDVRVVTPISVGREDSRLELSFRAIDRDGNASSGFGTLLGGERGFQFFRPPTTLRLAPGSYTVQFATLVEFDALVQPRLDLVEDTTVILDDRLARPMDIGVPGQPLDVQHVQTVYADVARGILLTTTSDQLFATAQLGPAPAPGEVVSYAAVDAVPAGSTDGSSVYLFGHRADGWMTGFTEIGTRDRIATVRASHRARADQTHEKYAVGFLPDFNLVTPNHVASAVHQGAFSRIEHYVGDSLVWLPGLDQLDEEIDGFFPLLSRLGDVPSYLPGQSYVDGWNHAPFGPALDDLFTFPAAARAGNVLVVAPTMFSDVSRPSRAGLSRGSLRGTLFRDGVAIAEQDKGDDSFEFFNQIRVPPERARYRFEVEAKRVAEASDLSPLVTAAWSFESAHTDARQVLALPTLRFAPVLDDDNSAPRRLPLVLPVEIERPRGAPTPAVRDVTVEASFDDGATWARVPGVLFGTHFLALVVHPPRAAFVSLRGSARDADGNRVDQTIIRAYRLR